MNRYDAIVIGAGLGGLSAAAFLAKKGQRVLLLEKHNIPGGYATSFVRGRFEFEIALHALSGIGHPDSRGDLFRYLDFLGVAEKVEFLPLKEMFRTVFPGLDITLPYGKEPYIQTLADAFPQEADGIRRFVERFFVMAREIDQLAKTQRLGNPLTAPSRLKNAIRYLVTPLGPVLERDVKDPLARAVICQLWGYIGLPPAKASYVYYTMMLASYIKRGGWFMRGRSQALSSAICDTFQEQGGQVRYNSPVKKILIQNGRASGVQTEGGETYESDFVVSNADPVRTAQMLGEKNVPGWFYKLLKPSKLAASTINIYLGVNRSPEQLGIRAHENFINSDPDFDSRFETHDSLQPPKDFLLTCWSAVDPGVSPPGTTLIGLTSLAFGEPWCNLDPHKYVETKNRIAESMLERAEQYVPGLRKYAEVVEVATPLTNMRYAGAMGGSIYGWANPPWDHSMLRIPHRGPVAGLYFVGAWTQPGGGFEPTLISGQMAGAQILRKARKEK